MQSTANSRTVRRRQSVRLFLASVVGVALAAGTVWAADSIDQAADAPTERAVRVDPPTRAVVIGDSAIAALRWVPGADNAIVGFDHVLDLESCRRLYTTSCYGREQRRPPTLYQAIDTYSGRFHTLVVATGYNDGTGVFADAFDAVVRKARDAGFARIVWYTLRSEVDYTPPDSVGNHETFARNNRTLRDLVATGRYPEVVLADWGGYSSGRHEWFVTDGVHYRQLGAWAGADYLTRKMAFLEGRPCPVPTSPGASVDDPCPDPDVTGPIADIDALYTIGEEGLLCYEIGGARRYECRYDTHVIELTREMRLGDSGLDVQALQTRLVRVGAFAGSTDGAFGDATRSAVIAFQESESLPTTGVADVTVLAALGFDTDAIPT